MNRVFCNINSPLAQRGRRAVEALMAANRVTVQAGTVDACVACVPVQVVRLTVDRGDHWFAPDEAERIALFCDQLADKSRASGDDLLAHVFARAGESLRDRAADARLAVARMH